MRAICASFPYDNHVWYLVGVHKGYPILSLNEGAARWLPDQRALNGLRWCRENGWPAGAHWYLRHPGR